MTRRESLALLGVIPVALVAHAADVATGAGAPKITVYKSESCGCCKLWVQHLLDAGFAVQAHDVDNLASVKERVGVPAGKGSCHTAEVDHYFLEGHVPAADIRRLLRERPAAKGLTVPGMPLGSPGMEVPSGQGDPYEVLLVALDGSTSVYARYGK
ncbi:MAG: DUF411 domain-containing protein [Steroidobacteraceae bacterium]|nr:DUF411 domain-containing protein [Steroidobacteraceae bacterium]